MRHWFKPNGRRAEPRSIRQMLTDTILEDDRWQEADLPALAERAAQAALGHLALDPRGFEIAVLGCNDARIATLNTEFRDKPAPTNVLSWPAAEMAAGDAPASGELGDIAIAFETCQREAEEAGKPLAAHVTHLMVHATLHLLGYDHMEDEEAEQMEALETAILASLGEADPYL